MARNVGLQILRGSLVNIPSLNDGEFYFATDTGQLYVGFGGLNFKVGTGMALVQIQDSSGNSINSTAGAVDVSAASLPLPANASQEAGGNLATIASNTTTIALNTTNETSGAAKTQVTDPTTFTGANVSAKGTQGANALAVQELKDSGRTAVFFSPLQAGIASVTTEALLTFNTVVGVTQTVGVTSYTVPAGKTLRIQYIRCKARFTTPSTTVTFANVQFNFRNAAAIATTNYLFGVQIDCASNAATPDVELPIPDGWELPAGSVVAFSQLGSAATLTLSFDVKGYLY